MKHPSLESLKKYAAGDLFSDLAENVQDHIDECDVCATLVSDLLNISKYTTSSAAHREKSATTDLVEAVRFERVTPIASGGFGDVYRAFDQELRRDVALKICRNNDGLEEARIATKLSAHPNIVKIYDIVSDDRNSIIVMEFLSGVTLDRWKSEAQSLPEKDVAKIVASIADAVAFAHTQEIVHLDLKPSNIIVDSDSTPILIDFGISVTRSQLESDHFDGLPGTWHYMPPEQLLGKVDKVSPKSDVWSLGVLLFELLTDKRPYGGVEESQVLKNMKAIETNLWRFSMSPELEEVCRGCLRFEPIDRHISASKIATMLQSFFGEKRTPKAKINTWFVSLIIGTLVMIAIGYFYFFSEKPISYYKKYDKEIASKSYQHFRRTNSTESLMLPQNGKACTVWQQFFVGGYVIYDVTNDKVFVLEDSSKTFSEHKRVNSFIRQGDKWKDINWDVSKPLLENIPDDQKASYLDLLYSKTLVGGIGTIFFKHQLLDELGKPDGLEELSPDTIFVEHEDYYFYAGLSNRPNLYENLDYLPRLNRPAIAVMVLFRSGQREGQFQKHTLHISDFGYDYIRLKNKIGIAD